MMPLSTSSADGTGLWVAATVAIVAIVILLPLAFRWSTRAVVALRTSVFTFAPLVSASLAAALARSAQTAAEGALLGAIVGVGALLGTLAGLTLVGAVLGSNHSFQEFARASEPHPSGRIPYRWIAPLGATAGAVTGLMLGAGNLLLAMLAGIVVGGLR